MNEYLTEIIIGIITFISGLITSFFTRKTKKEEEKKDFFRVITERLDQEIISLKKEKQALKTEAETLIIEKDVLISSLHEKIERLARKISDLEKEVMIKASMIRVLESGFEHLPFPYWLKTGTLDTINEGEARMEALNKAYEEAFLQPVGKYREDYIGKTDAEFWGDEIGKIFKENDQKAATASDGTWLGEEKHNNLFSGWKFFKFARYYQGQIVGVGGMAIRESEFI